MNFCIGITLCYIISWAFFYYIFKNKFVRHTLFYPSFLLAISVLFIYSSKLDFYKIIISAVQDLVAADYVVALIICNLVFGVIINFTTICVCLCLSKILEGKQDKNIFYDNEKNPCIKKEYVIVGKFCFITSVLSTIVAIYWFLHKDYLIYTYSTFPVFFITLTVYLSFFFDGANQYNWKLKSKQEPDEATSDMNISAGKGLFKEHIILVKNNLQSSGADKENSSFCDVEEKNERLEKILNNEEDMLLVSPTYTNIPKSFMDRIYDDVIRFKKVLILTSSPERSKQRDDEKKWFRDSISLTKYKEGNIVSIESLNDFTESIDILICTPGEILYKNISSYKRWLKSVCKVIVINIDKSIFSNILPASALLNIVRDLSCEQLQYIFMSTNQNLSIKVAARAYLKAIPKEVLIKKKANQGEIVTWFKKEKCYNSICDNLNINHSSCPEFVFASNEMAAGNTSVYLQWVSLQPWKEYIETLEDSVDLGTKRRDGSAIKVINQPEFHTIEKEATIIVSDFVCNAPLLLSMNSKILEKPQIYIFSNNYLLRDYLADNFEFFRSNPIHPLVPHLTKDKIGVALILYERLRVKRMEESKIRDIIYDFYSKSEERSLDFELQSLFDYSYSSFDLYSQVKIEEINKFDEKDDEFKSLAYYQIPQEFSGEWVKNYRDVYQFKDSCGRVLNIVYGHQLYQKYLPGQYHCFDGEMYEIKSIDSVAKIVNIEYVRCGENYLYRNIVDFTYRGTEDGVALNSVFDHLAGDELTLSTKVFGCNYSIKSKGFYEFYHGISFGKGDYKRVDLDETIQRDMKHGRCLSIELSTSSNSKIKSVKQTVSETDDDLINENKKDLVVDDIDGRLSLTLAILMREVFYTLLPSLKEYVHIVVPHIDIDKLSEFESKIYEINFLDQSLKSDEPTTDSDKNILLKIAIFEDSIVDMGLCLTIERNIYEIFEIIEDYLSSMPNKKDSNNYLEYGAGYDFNERLRLDEVQEVLEKVLKHRRCVLKKKRSAFWKRKRL